MTLIPPEIQMHCRTTHPRAQGLKLFQGQKKRLREAAFLEKGPRDEDSARTFSPGVSTIIRSGLRPRRVKGDTWRNADTCLWRENIRTMYFACIYFVRESRGAA